MRRIHMSLLMTSVLCMACAGTSISEEPSVENAVASTTEEAPPQDTEAEVPTEDDDGSSDTSTNDTTEPAET
mgnify:CR=1 FL=1